MNLNQYQDIVSDIFNQPTEQSREVILYDIDKKKERREGIKTTIGILCFILFFWGLIYIIDVFTL